MTALNYLRSLLFLFIIALLARCKEPHTVKPAPPSPDFEKAMSLLKTNKDSAFYYFNKVATSPGESQQIARAYTRMAILQSDAADPFGSQETLLQALKFLDEKKDSDRYTLASVYNELAVTNIALRNYQAALDYCNQGLKFTKERFRIITILNNRALACQKLNQYDQALSIYRSILDESKNNPAEYARVLTNMANTKQLRDVTYDAAPELLAALQIRENQKDNWGLSSSYAHLSDYYARSHPDSALHYANKMYRMAQQLGSPRDELLALPKLIQFSPPELVKKYFTRYRHLNDSVQTARNNAKNQFALIRYEAEKNKANNLVLQKANAEKKVQIIWQRIILFGVLLFASLGFWWYRKQRQRTLREYQLKTSKKVHDVVANGLYRVMSKIEHGQTGGKEQLLDEMGFLYEQSRNISYEQPEKEEQEFQASIANLLKSFSSAATSISIVGNSEKFWNRMPLNAKTELKHVLQELMVNMQKHSAAENVMIRFRLLKDKAEIIYTDDGKGLPSDFHFGNGLKNTENRISGMGGHLIFGKATTNGLKIELYIPIT
ncbi:MAG: ATP-binding protein [Niabella sp.]|nr:ATP-binding protein [Niabella sp.]